VEDDARGKGRVVAPCEAEPEAGGEAASGADEEDGLAADQVAEGELRTAKLRRLSIRCDSRQGSWRRRGRERPTNSVRPVQLSEDRVDDETHQGGDLVDRGAPFHDERSIERRDTKTGEIISLDHTRTDRRRTSETSPTTHTTAPRGWR
jgi:hypothetical protein